MLLKNLVNFLRRCQSIVILLTLGKEGKNTLKNIGYKLSSFNSRLEINSVSEFIEIIYKLYGVSDKILGRDLYYWVDNEFRVSVENKHLVFHLKLYGPVPQTKISTIYISASIEENMVFF